MPRPQRRWQPPDPGELRDRVTIQVNAPTRGPTGEPLDNWVTRDTVWAKVEHLSGAVYWQAQQVQAETTLVFTIRYRPDVVSSRCRLVWAGRNFEVKETEDPRSDRVWLIVRGLEVK